MLIFLIGPGGVGKSTTGKILADLVGYDFIDLDQEFCNQIEIIGRFIDNQGYEKYCYENSKLFLNILKKTKTKTVFALSSGFLVHEGLDELISKHKQTLQENGISILLLPSESIEESCNIVVARQLKRGFGLKEDREKEKFLNRYPAYYKLGDIKIFSHENPKKIAEKIKIEYEKFLT